MPARSEPLLWVQLLGAGLFPLEGLLLLMLLAGSDPGPVPGLERLLCWALGALAPSLLLWHRPADVWSLLLLQTPLRLRRPLQQRLSRLQEALVLRLGLVLGAAGSLPLLWWLDEHAALASSFSPLQGSPRLVVLLLAASLLAVMLWQWQQLLQALWLLSRSAEAVAAARPMAQAELEEQRLCIGLPLLLLEPLQLQAAAAGSGGAEAGAAAPVTAVPQAAAAAEPAESLEVADGPAAPGGTEPAAGAPPVPEPLAPADPLSEPLPEAVMSAQEARPGPPQGGAALQEPAEDRIEPADEVPSLPERHPAADSADDQASGPVAAAPLSQTSADASTEPDAVLQWLAPESLAPEAEATELSDAEPAAGKEEPADPAGRNADDVG